MSRLSNLSLAFALSASFLDGAATAAAAPQAPPETTAMTPDVVADYDAVRPQADYVKRVEMVPMRDGVKLYTVVVMKKGTHDGPILLSRTPYDAKRSAERTKSQSITEILPAMDAEFVADNYIRVYQDVRGLHHSEGEFVMTRPIIGPLNHTRVDESTDAYDTIDWLVKHVSESNGKVGVVGSSYLGFTTLMAEIDPHPALKAAVPESPMVDTWIGDDDFHNGAFRNPTMDYIVSESTAKGGGAAIAHGVGDDYTRYLQSGSSGDYARQWGIDQYPSMQKLMRNPAYTDFWSLQAVDKWMASRPLSVPIMLVVGQWDQEDSYGAPAVYKALAPKDVNHDMLTLVIGPWRHSGVNHYGYGLGALTPIGIEIFRGRYVHALDKPEALVPGKVEEYRFGLPNVDHVFLPGHRIMIQVQSSLFPLYDRNPQTYVDNIFNARPGDYKAVTESVYHGGGTASSVLLPIAP